MSKQQWAPPVKSSSTTSAIAVAVQVAHLQCRGRVQDDGELELELRVANVAAAPSSRVTCSRTAVTSTGVFF
ncbi:MAG: hypothetical protein U0Y82_00805 [Thermoleophilia bacterium]